MLKDEFPSMYPGIIPKEDENTTNLGGTRWRDFAGLRFRRDFYDWEVGMSIRDC